MWDLREALGADLVPHGVPLTAQACGSQLSQWCDALRTYADALGSWMALAEVEATQGGYKLHWGVAPRQVRQLRDAGMPGLSHYGDRFEDADEKFVDAKDLRITQLDPETWGAWLGPWPKPIPASAHPEMAQAYLPAFADLEALRRQPRPHLDLPPASLQALAHLGWELHAHAARLEWMRWCDETRATWPDKANVTIAGTTSVINNRATLDLELHTGPDAPPAVQAWLIDRQASLRAWITRDDIDAARTERLALLGQLEDVRWTASTDVPDASHWLPEAWQAQLAATRLARTTPQAPARLSRNRL